jgi:hypothetical protein
MYPKTPSCSQQQQHAGSLIRRRSRHHHHGHAQEESSLLSISPPPNLIEVPAEESSSPFSSSSSSLLPLSHFSFSPIDSQHQKHEVDYVDYVDDTVIVKHAEFSRNDATLFILYRFLKKNVLTLLVAVCSILCYATTLPPQINHILFFSNRPENDHDVPTSQGHFSRVVYLEPKLNTGDGEGIKVKASPSIMNTHTIFTRSNRNSSLSYMEDTYNDKINNNSNPMTLMTTKKPRQRILLDSQEYYDRPGVAAAPEFETHECKAQYQWQLDNLVTCNRIHELDMTTMTMTSRHQQAVNNSDNEKEVVSSSFHLPIRHLGSGFWRDAWIIMDSDIINHKDINYNNKIDQQQQYIVFKTMRYHHDFTSAANLDRHRRDAMTAEHYSKSPHVVNIYSHCGNSAFFEYGNGGDLEQVLGMNDNENDNDDEDEENETDPPTLLERFHIGK